MSSSAADHRALPVRLTGGVTLSRRRGGRGQIAESVVVVVVVSGEFPKVISTLPDREVYGVVRV